MSDSYNEEYLPVASNPQVTEDYVNLFGHIRVGLILEHMDALAGTIAYNHCDDGQWVVPPLTIVTASVDKIELMKPEITSEFDLRLSGFVSYVGHSSMEVLIILEACPEGYEKAKENTINEKKNMSDLEWKRKNLRDRGIKDQDTIMMARFMMVARDRETGKAAAVSQLLLEDEYEKNLFMKGASEKSRKQAAVQTSLSKIPPTIEEMVLVHDLFLDHHGTYDQPSYHSRSVEVSNMIKPGHIVPVESQQSGKSETVVWMKDTEQKSLFICMPQNRNIHDKIFGGYLMRKAFELAYATALVFIGGGNRRLSFVNLDEIVFKKPVNIGSLLNMTAVVVYSEQRQLNGSSEWTNYFHIQVVADVMDPYDTSKTDRTNVFWLTFRGGLNEKVVPKSYEESMLYIEGKRRMH